MYEEYTKKIVTNAITTIEKHVKSTEQGIIGILENFIESENERVMQYICID